MLSSPEAQARAHALIERARRHGADEADAVFVADSSESIQVRLGKLEDVERSESEHIGLRVFVGKRSASIGSSDLSDDALETLAERAVAMARTTPEDIYAGLAPDELLLRGALVPLDLEDRSEPSAAQLRASALEAEDAARAIEGVTNSEGAGASFGRGVFALATSRGFSGGYGSSSHSVSAAVVAGTGSDMQRDYAYRTARHGADIPAPSQIGTLAGQRAVARVSPGRLESGMRPVVFDPRIAGTLVGHLLGAISGSAIARRASFLLGKLDETLFAPGLVIVEDPLRPRGLRSRPFDGEGLPTARRTLVEGGKVTGWLMDSASARQLGAAPTGHAARGGGGAPGISVGNVDLLAGTLSPAELIADIADGVYVTEVIGQGVNGVTGDYSRGAAGFRIVDGQIAGPVAEFTIAGNLLTMFAAMTAADDLETYRAVNTPTLRVDGMAIAGD